jgi:DNA (cytosine-5)-methyltransferase 1
MASKLFRFKRRNGFKICEEESVYAARENGSLLRRRSIPKLIDLFAGAGGMSLGFSETFGHRFEVVWANDFDKNAAKTYAANFGIHCVVGDILAVLNTGLRIPAADVVIGGPPCQGFSLLNKKRSGDPRKQLWRPFLDIVLRSGASIFVMENVPQLLGSPEHDQINQIAKEAGFITASTKLCAADYGTPQTRWRAFIIGCKFMNPSEVFPPKKTHYNPRNGYAPDLFGHEASFLEFPKPWRTVRNAIGDLPKPEGMEIRMVPPPLDLHFGRKPTEVSIKRYRAIPKEGMNRFDLQRVAPELTPQCWIRKITGGTDLFGRLWWDRPAFTIRTEFFKPEKGRYLHPAQHRPITHREAARLQGFPDSFKFIGTKVDVAKQIGNAVPPPLAARIADVVCALLETKKQG